MLNNIRYWIWIYNSYLTGEIKINRPEKATVILPYFNQKRIKHARYMVRLLLRCNFINEIIATNHNPELDIFQWIDIKDTRLKLINNNGIKHGSGYRWVIANTLDSKYFLVIDDDFLIFPGQLAKLFCHLIIEPDVPHGLTGKMGIDGIYCKNVETEVEILNQIFAVTKKHIKKFMSLSETVRLNQPEIYHDIEEYADDIVISMTGKLRPKIHNVGYNLRCPTATEKGIALHKEKSFLGKRLVFKKVLDDIQSLNK